jgi:hypothetical protein
MTSNLKILLAAVGFAALAATPVMAKSHVRHRGVDAIPVAPLVGPAVPFAGYDWQLGGRLPLPDSMVPYR